MKREARPLPYLPGLVLALAALPVLGVGFIAALVWQFLKWGWYLGWWCMRRFEKTVEAHDVETPIVNRRSGG